MLLIFLFTSSCIKYNVNGTTPYTFAISDYNNNRVLLWHSYVASNQQPADLVLGQPNFSTNTSNTGGISAATMHNPNGLCMDSQHIFVGDTANQRVLIWNHYPTTNFQPADVILGQPGPTSNTANNGGLTTGFLGPQTCFSDGRRFYLSDTYNNRILIWNTIPTSNRSADLVLGQPNLATGMANNPALPPSAQLSGTGTAYFDGIHLVVADGNNNRVLIWNSFPTMNGQSADLVLGQPDFNSISVNAGGGAANPTASTLDTPTDILVAGSKLFVSDFNNSRILIWNTFPTLNQQPADVVVGQLDMLSKTNPVSQTGGSPATGAFVDENRLIVNFAFANRTLIWNAIPTANGQPANLVLGQSNFSTSAANAGAVVGPNTLYAPGRSYSNINYSGTWRPDEY